MDASNEHKAIQMDRAREEINDRYIRKFGPGGDLTKVAHLARGAAALVIHYGGSAMDAIEAAAPWTDEACE